MQGLVPEMLAALGLGLMGGGHCLSMCGGIVAALSMSGQGQTAAQKSQLQICYNRGRITTYALLGGIVASLFSYVPQLGLPIGRTVAGLLLVFLGLYFLGKSQGILWLERLGQSLWSIIRPWATTLVPLNHPLKAFLAGIIWGWLPCGLAYSALAYAATQGAFLSGAGVMIAFGVGTLPALFIGGLAATQLQRWFRKDSVRLVLAGAYIVFGIWTIGAAWYHSALHHHNANNVPAAHQH